MTLYYRSILIAASLFLSLMSFGQSTSIELGGNQTGMLINRLTNLQRNAITTPDNGLMIFNMDTGCLNYHFNAEWHEVCGIIISTCDDNSDCATGTICVNGVCEDDPASQSCETSEQCPEGWFCVDGFCAQP